MSARPANRSLWRRLANWLLATVGVCAILLAVALGVFRLMIGQIPEYQAEIKAWVAEETGLVVDFAALDARLGFAGPELSLSDVRISDDSSGNSLQADAAAITLDAFALAFRRSDQRIRVSRLTLVGVQLTVERDASGRIRLGEFDTEPGTGSLADLVMQSVVVSIRDSVLRYVDRPNQREWEFDDFEIEVESIDGQLSAEASVRSPAALARRIDFAALGDISADGPNSWRLRAAAGDVDLAGLVDLLPLPVDLELSGLGQLSLGAEWVDGRLALIDYQAALAAVQIGTPAADNAAFDRLAFAGNLELGAGGNWRLGLSDIDVERLGRSWDRSAAASFALERDNDGIQAVAFDGGFFRLDDIEPIVRAFPASQLAEQWALFEPSGEIRDLEFTLRRRSGSFDYTLDASFEGLAVNQAGGMPGLAGVSGRVQAGEYNGRLELDSGPIRLDWPALFARTVMLESLSGAVSWLQSRDGVQVLGVNLGVGLLGETVRGGFDLKLPGDSSSPTLELKADLDRFDLVPAKDWLPEPILPAPIVAWLDRAVAGGEARDVELSFSGPLRSFPFDDGSGEFSVAADIVAAELDYLADWPRATDVAGRIEFRNAGFSASGSGRTLSNRVSAVTVEVPDVRAAELALAIASEGPLAGVVEYLRAVPSIAQHLGPDFGRLDARGGTGSVQASLAIPLRRLDAFSLDARLAISDGTLAIAGLGPQISEINGAIQAREDTVEAEGLSGIFLGGPVTASLARSERDGYRAELAVAGETSVEEVAASFSIPHDDLLAGQTLWRGRLLLPALDPLATTATRIVIESNLAGVALKFPEPLAKSPGEPVNLRLDLEFAPGRRLAVDGNLGATRRFALSFQGTDDGFEFRHGAVRFGGDAPTLPISEGILVNGQIETLALDDWLDLAGSSGFGRAGTRFLGADIEVADFSVFGQRLGATDLRVQRGAAAWEIAVDSAAIAGDIRVPSGNTSREAVVANMRRFYLAAADGGDLASVDPRRLPGLELEADEFGFGARRFGRVRAVVEADRRGLVLTELTSETENYRAAVSGNWFLGPLRMRTSIDVSLSASDVAAALAELGLDPAISGESAEVRASVFFDTPPGSDWLDHLNGEVEIFVDTGTLREIDPGAGRMLGLMSIAALPRRLALDFRDVFEDGFAFDEIGGSFRLIDGNAYTNDLKFTGPAAEIGVVGRTGLRDRDYTQQVVVSPEPGNMLPTVAGLLAGPGAGAAFFVFTRLFKEPLKNIGQAAYCLEGSWDAPTIERIGNDEQERARQCADIPDALRSDRIDE